MLKLDGDEIKQNFLIKQLTLNNRLILILETFNKIAF